MRDYENEHLEFLKKFGCEKQCRDYLYALRFPWGICCPHCQHSETKDKTKIQYRCKKCRKLIYLYGGTIFENTRKPLTCWFASMWFVTLQINNLSAMQRLAKISYNTALEWYPVLNQLMLNSKQYKLNGKITIEDFIRISIYENQLHDEGYLSPEDFYEE